MVRLPVPGLILLMFVLVLSAPAVSSADEGGKTVAGPPSASPGPAVDQDNLVTCYARTCGVTFLCDPSWKIKLVDPYSTIITISSDPFVALAITRIDSHIRLLGQLTRPFFEDRKLYLDNFQQDYASFADGQAIQLKAFSKIEPDMRYLGYFYIHNETLNSVFFAVYPKDRWDEYKFFIKKIVDSFRRI